MTTTAPLPTKRAMKSLSTWRPTSVEATNNLPQSPNRVTAIVGAPILHRAASCARRLRGEIRISKLSKMMTINTYERYGHLFI